MNNSIKRFIQRLNLKENHYFNLISIEMNEIKKEPNIPNILNQNVKLELYHTIRDYEYKEIFQKIKKDNFMEGMYGNKGPGIYMANHSRYSFGWGYNDDGIRNVIISDVIYDKDYVKRYRSEIYSPNFNSEYKITKSELIYPKYFVLYKIDNLEKYYYKNYENWGYVKHGNFGCKKCDFKVDRCDCELESYDDFDLV
jgi:hypothetical protein